LQKYHQANRISIEKIVVDQAVDGLEAYHQTKQKFFDIVFMNDYNPKLNGNESVKKIRKF
jgi:DNA-binding response OmpR family regulator